MNSALVSSDFLYVAMDAGRTCIMLVIEVTFNIRPSTMIFIVHIMRGLMVSLFMPPSLIGLVLPKFKFLLLLICSNLLILSHVKIGTLKENYNIKTFW